MEKLGTAYRFEDRRCSVADEYGDHSYSVTEIHLHAFEITKRTRCGIWVKSWGCDRRFVNQKATKQFAHETIEDALRSFVARKKRQEQIYRARADLAREAVHVLRRRYPAHYRDVFGEKKGDELVF